jgi:hypothetical protein
VSGELKGLTELVTAMVEKAGDTPDQQRCAAIIAFCDAVESRDLDFHAAVEVLCATIGVLYAIDMDDTPRIERPKVLEEIGTTIGLAVVSKTRAMLTISDLMDELDRKARTH